MKKIILNTIMGFLVFLLMISLVLLGLFVRVLPLVIAIVGAVWIIKAFIV